ncbi:hypothetical protein ACFSTH_08445 [Paenibacillus yanchengensis]|uniref:Uncharacterized protein n=1 Tax=Paenibacillus yanchengensis TaxID=2035833 RepID=A0ABW4YL42_9BACL
MKFKKIFIVAIALFMLTFAQSAYAESIKPFAAGIGDTIDTAIPISPNTGFMSLFLSNQFDVDFFTWKNTTNSPLFVDFSLRPPIGSNYNYVYDFEYFIRYPDGISSTSAQAVDKFLSTKFVSRVYLPANCEIFFMVKATVFNNPTDFYEVAMGTSSINY